MVLSFAGLAEPASAQPLVPTGLRVTATTPTTVNLTWNQSGEANIANYSVHRSSANGQLGPLVGRPTARSFTDSGLEPGTTYWYYLKAVDTAGSEGYRSGMVAAVTAGAATGTRVIAVGDMASCDGNNLADQVGNLLDVRPGKILALGDLAYPNGSDEDFANCFDPKLGRHKDRMIPVPGNHEYYTPGAAGYVRYFGLAAGPADKLYYEEWIDGWQVLALNSNCSEVGGCGVGSPQYQWLQGVLTTAPSNVCRVAMMHHPRWTSYTNYADQAYLGPLHQLLYDAGTDLVLAGHAHHYERFNPQNASGQAAADGFQLMIVGTGGVPLRQTGNAVSNSAARIQSHGIAEFDLQANSFRWTFRNLDGVQLDGGSRDCVNAEANPPVNPPVTPPAQPPAATPFTPKPNEIDAKGGNVFRLYRAVFRRDPDNGGFTYWHTLHSRGMSLEDVAVEFAASPEFLLQYGNLNNRDFVRRLYLNVMHREPDQGGWDYWTDILSAGNSRGNVVIWFSQSAEFARANPFP